MSNASAVVSMLAEAAVSAAAVAAAADDDHRHNSGDVANVTSTVSTTPSLSSSEAWLRTLQKGAGLVVVSALALIGVLFNLASIGFLGRREVRMRKSLVRLFCFLNTFDRCVKIRRTYPPNIRRVRALGNKFFFCTRTGVCTANHFIGRMSREELFRVDDD